MSLFPLSSIIKDRSLTGAPIFFVIYSRDVASLSGAEQDLFSRAAVKVMNELFSREDLSEMVGREVDELSQRDLEELLEREVDLSESTMDIAARELTSYIDDVELAALDGVLVPRSPAAPLLVVSMKANLRHAGAALGTTSLTQPWCVWSSQPDPVARRRCVVCIWCEPQVRVADARLV